MLIAVKALRSSEMLAWQAERFGEPLDVLGLKEMEKPVPGPGEVLIKVRAVGLGLPDLMAVQGRYPLITLPPAIPGHSFAGTIDSTGPGSSFTPGMRVMARTMYKNQAGALAEYALAREFDTFPVPDALDDAQAAGFVVPYQTAQDGQSVREGKSGSVRVGLGGGRGRRK